MDLWTLRVLPVGLGLLGFIEPCTVGSSLLFVKYLEGREVAAKLLETTIFAATRALFIGSLGALAALIGSAFLDLQRWLWVLLGSAYVALGVVYLVGTSRRAPPRSWPPCLRRASARRRSRRGSG
jgi:cytochrome c-type biogenesis protein